jgi:hypothetical protein
MVEPFWWFLKILNTHLMYDPVIPHKRNKNILLAKKSQRFIRMCIIITSSLKLDTIWSTGEQKNKM